MAKKLDPHDPLIEVQRIQKWVKQFSDVLEMPEMYDDLNRLLKKRRRKTMRK